VVLYELTCIVVDVCVCVCVCVYVDGMDVESYEWMCTGVDGCE
jgi:hypothetical protein